MPTSEIHERINALLQLIEINNNRLFLNEREIPKIELHQLRNYIVELYAEVDKLELSGSEKESDKTKKITPPANPEIGLEAPVLPSEKKEPEPRNEPVENTPKEEVYEIENRVKEEVSDRPDVIDEVIQEKPAAIEEVETPKQEKIEEVSQPASTPEKKEVEVPQPSTTRGDLYEKFKHSKLASIKKGISISKRYEIQNELFKNEAESYNEAINSLDNSASLEDAIYLIDNEYSEKYGWEADSPLVDELKILCLRRHM